MNEQSATNAVSWAILRSVGTDQVLPHLLVPLNDLPEDLLGELRTFEQMNRDHGRAEIPPIKTYGIATGPQGQIGLFAVRNVLSGGGGELWPAQEFAMAADPQLGWYAAQNEFGQAIITAYTDIFLAAFIAEHDEQVGRAQVQRFLETSSWGVIQCFAIRSLSA